MTKKFVVDGGESSEFGVPRFDAGVRCWVSIVERRNKEISPIHTKHSFRDVQKSGHDLVLAAADVHNIYRVGAYSGGYIRDLIRGKAIDVGLGIQAALNKNPSALSLYYGGTTHGGWQVFMRFRPS